MNLVVIPALGKPRQRGCCGFEASLVHIVKHCRCGKKTQAHSHISPPPPMPSTFMFLHVSNLGGDPQVGWLFLSPQNMLYREGLSIMGWWGEVRCGSEADYESSRAFSFRIPFVCLSRGYLGSLARLNVIKCVFHNYGSLLHYEDM